MEVALVTLEVVVDLFHQVVMDQVQEVLRMCQVVMDVLVFRKIIHSKTTTHSLVLFTTLDFLSRTFECFQVKNKFQYSQRQRITNMLHTNKVISVMVHSRSLFLNASTSVLVNLIHIIFHILYFSHLVF